MSWLEIKTKHFFHDFEYYFHVSRIIEKKKFGIVCLESNRVQPVCNAGIITTFERRDVGWELAYDLQSLKVYPSKKRKELNKKSQTAGILV